MSRFPTRVTMILAITALFIGGDVEASPESESAKATSEAFEQLTHEFNDAILGLDEAALVRLLADDCTTGGDVILTKSQFIDQIMTTIPPKAQTLEAMSVKVYGDTAIVTGLADAVWVSPAGAGSDRFRWVNVWFHGDNGWQIVYIQTTKVGLFSSEDGC